MKHNPVLFLSIIALMVLTSFTGKDKGVKDEGRRIAILTAGRWKMTDSYARYEVGGKTVKHSKWHHLDSCFKDNQMLFGANHRVYQDQGLLKCNKLTKRIDSNFKWRLDNAEDMLWLESAVFTQPLYIEYISDSVLEVNEHHFFGDSAFIKVYTRVGKNLTK